MYLPGEEITPSLGQYVEAIAEGLEEGYERAPAMRVVLETGRALVDDAGVVVATVLANKRLVDGRRAVIIDAGVNLLPTAWWYRHAVGTIATVLRKVDSSPMSCRPKSRAIPCRRSSSFRLPSS